jgi:hypothetical protein
MTERERWIVYPLLFLALGAALRDKLVDRTTTKSIVCQELLVVDEESTGPQSQRVLARIGRDKSKKEPKPTATMVLNGDLQIIDDDLSETSPARILVTVGRTEPPAGIPASGFAIVRGELAVDGVLEAKQYVWQHMPIVPMQVAPGVAVLGVLQAVSQPGPKAPNPTAPKTQPSSQPPASGAKKGSSAAPPSSPADKQSPSDE